MSDSKRQVTVLGSTGSIGCSTLDVIAQHPDQFGIYALTANSRVEELVVQCRRFKPTFAVIADESRAAALASALSNESPDTQVLAGAEALQQVAAASEVDVVMAAIVGAVGLDPTLAAVNAGKTVLLANKEALVMAGALFMDAVADSGATILPIDSEHNAIFQCLPEVVQNGAGLGGHGIRCRSGG